MSWNVARYTLAWKFQDLRPGASLPDVSTLEQIRDGEVGPPHPRELDTVRDEIKADQPMLKKDHEEAEIPPPEPVVIRKREETKGSCFANINSYVTILSIMGFLITTDTMHRFAVLTTLQKRFNFATMESGIIISSYDIGHVILLVLLGYFGGNIHKPRWLAIGGIMVAIAGVLWSLPHFLFGPGPKPIEIDSLNNTELETMVCHPNGTAGLNSGESFCPDIGNATTKGDSDALESTIAFWILFTSQCFIGGGLAPFLTLGISYIDDNTDPQSSALYVGIVYSIGTLGMVMGFLLGAILTGTYVDLSDTHLDPQDPQWLGAWWLGSICIAGGCLLFSIPMGLFPRSLPKPGKKKHKGHQRHSKGSRLGSVYGSIRGKGGFMPKEYSFPVALKMLCTNVVFQTTTIGLCAMTYLAGGVFTFLPKYIETQFGQLSWVANVITAGISAGAMASGTFFGGWLAARLRLTPPGSIKLITISCALGLGVLVSLMFVGCQQVEIAGVTNPDDGLITIDTPCNLDCGCDLGFSPVCGSDGVTYYSACYAGCNNFSNYITDEIANYTNCGCVETSMTGVPGGGNAKTGWCATNCITLVPYAILFFFMVFGVTTGMAPILSITLRCVEPELKPLALSINNILTSVLASIPGPMLYGMMIDSTCKFWESTCEGGQFCLLYDFRLFRLLLHGVTVGVLGVGLICFVIAWLKLRTMKFTEEGEMITDEHDHEINMVNRRHYTVSTSSQ
ncbi:unnamed protein product [Owenia fusiformis]|uniref:Solute carrier organic anion transporter family member n=1 Tax=Owenia fusiformis TaxID=6347 RepID=A0A8S4N0L8_OWEFU|nr:unnamed protein product [Owenia fusiformis]